VNRPTLPAEPFDWQGWIDAERKAAERRTGSALDRAIQDPRYARALDIWSRRNRALTSLAQAEREARSMAGGVQ
jgi:hypothetical protein